MRSNTLRRMYIWGGVIWLFILVGINVSAYGTTGVVTTTDLGTIGSLDRLIMAGNQGAIDTILFNIPGSPPYVISPNNVRLPVISRKFVIDATSQPGFSDGNVIIDGANLSIQMAEGLRIIQSNGAEIYGLFIRNFNIGVYVEGDGCILGAPGKGNIISENFSHGIYANCCTGLIITGNKIGVDSEGNPLPNGTIDPTVSGIYVEDSGCLVPTEKNRIGGIQPGEGNIIGYHPGWGISMAGMYNAMFGNQFMCNKKGGIELRMSTGGIPANEDKSAPLITDAFSEIIAGIADPGDRIEVYGFDGTLCGNTVCQGAKILGFTQADEMGFWELEGDFSRESRITALATDDSLNTSPFSACQVRCADAPPPVNLGTDIVTCTTDGIVLDADSGTVYQWSTGDSTRFISVTLTGTYFVRRSFFGCISSDTININILAGDTAQFTTSKDAIIKRGQAIDLFAGGGLSYRWTPDSTLSCGACSDPLATPSTTTIYQVEIEVGLNCSVFEEVRIDVVETPNKHMLGKINNFISPNGDGINDTWIVRNLQLFPVNALVIVNRWGNKVFEASPYQNNFEGVDDAGNMLEEGAYYYMLDLGKNASTLENICKGSITILRE